MTAPGEKPKIIVDDDWKTRAQEEKEQLQKAAEAEKKQEGAGETEDSQPETAEAESQAEEMPIPAASFSVLITSLATQALAMLGQVPMEDGKPVLRLDHAKHFIDTLAILEEKTKGNLESSEMVMLNNVLHELRMVYVEASKHVPSTLAE
ncbi:MAG: hypothetical protein CMJ64_12920 [Planctomycetaceae bacterium]|nr:hypothetical protein [Planctomycetaceae bacterium]